MGSMTTAAITASYRQQQQELTVDSPSIARDFSPAVPDVDSLTKDTAVTPADLDSPASESAIVFVYVDECLFSLKIERNDICLMHKIDRKWIREKK